MLKIISCKNDSEAYKLATAEKAKAKFESGFLDLEVKDSMSAADNISLLGTRDAYLVEVAAGDYEMITESFVQTLTKSDHLFVFIGSGAEFERLWSGQKVIKPVEARSFDFPAALVAAVQAGDKKSSWHLLLKQLRIQDAEPVHGSLTFAYKSLLTVLNDEKNNHPDSGVKDFSWKQAKAAAEKGRRKQKEVVEKYFNLVVAYHKSRNGEGDLSKQLEKWVLEN